MTMPSGNGSPAELLRKAEFEPVSALAEYRLALRQRLLAGASGADVMTALTEFVDRLIIARYKKAMRKSGGRRHRSRGTSTVAWWPWEDTDSGSWLPIQIST